MKNIIAKVLAFTVPSLSAAGISAGTVGFDSSSLQAPSAGLADAKTMIDRIESRQAFTLAQHASHSSHSSHGSHASHGSHSSHSSGGVLLGSLDSSEVGRVDYEPVVGRNFGSTPTNAILPSSPAITDLSNEKRKLKVLPGNSGKFKDTVLRTQVALATKGYSVGEINGELHARTVAAVYEFQLQSGLEPTGKLSPDTLSRLGIVVS
jgi:His-Xaa-Ser repeat protein HxsA